MARCSICNYYETRGGMCGPCCRSYDRYAFGDVSVRTAIVWAARRARRFEQRRARAAAQAASWAYGQMACMDKYKDETPEQLAVLRRICRKAAGLR